MAKKNYNDLEKITDVANLTDRQKLFVDFYVQEHQCDLQTAVDVYNAMADEYVSKEEYEASLAEEEKTDEEIMNGTWVDPYEEDETEEERAERLAWEAEVEKEASEWHSHVADVLASLGKA